MKRSTLFWILAFLITFIAAYYQRVTGPTYPLSGTISVSGTSINYKFERSHGGETNALVQLQTNDESIMGTVEWKRYKTSDDWTSTPMIFQAGVLSAELPHQPAAGKLQYCVKLLKDGRATLLPANEPVVIRFKGDVPLFILIPHVIAMFSAMLLSTRTGLEFFSNAPSFKQMTYWTLGVLFVGGLLLGPAVQLYAFNAWWTGWPFGTDLTDNKTAMAFLGWVAATVALSKSKNPKWWILGAAIILLVVYLIPHSMFGSELDYASLDNHHSH